MKRRDFLQYAGAAAMLGTVAAPVLAQPADNKFALVGFDESAQKLLRLENYLGKVCLISFFTSACNLCNHDLKLMREFYLSNKKKDFMLIGVNMDDSRNDFDSYRKLVELTIPKEQSFPLLWRKGTEYVDNFGPIKQKPTHFVLDKAHKLVFKREGTFQPDDWNRVWDKVNGQ
ncbi:redoxin domain-containing protein [Massilia sp. W12]|uniref:redoxin domain-containing protein n=1 Tax=Massilia sp. W12 TaxID=3126507 RepID=UPI0030CE4DCB